MKDLVEKMGQEDQPTVSYHLSILRSAGLIRIARRERLHTYYQVCPDALRDVQAEFATFQATVSDERAMKAASHRNRKRA